MAAEVGPIAGYVKGYEEDKHRRAVGNDYAHHEKSAAPITRDLLGGLHGIESQELDLDLQVPLGWEKRLDLKSGKVYLQRCSSTSSSSGERARANHTVSKFQDLNSPPSPSKSSLSLLDDANLDLKLTSSAVPRSSCGYQSVCTLDKVKTALEKAEREPGRKRLPFWRPSPSSSSSAASNTSSSSSAAEIQLKKEEMSSSPVAAGCPCCLLYVLISKSNPKCPRCNAMVPMPTSKRPRIDLNISI